jgi:hypothetical protein
LTLNFEARVVALAVLKLMALATWAWLMNCSPGRAAGVEDTTIVGEDTGEGEDAMVVAVGACEIPRPVPVASFDKPVAMK